MKKFSQRKIILLLRRFYWMPFIVSLCISDKLYLCCPGTQTYIQRHINIVDIVLLLLFYMLSMTTTMIRMTYEVCVHYMHCMDALWMLLVHVLFAISSMMPANICIQRRGTSPFSLVFEHLHRLRIKIITIMIICSHLPMHGHQGSFPYQTV